jgi:hypothetical protein
MYTAFTILHNFSVVGADGVNEEVSFCVEILTLA